MIPQTLLWVGLVVAWLVVLVPMLVARHPKVNTVTDATLKTKLLHRGGSAKLALRRKIRPSGTTDGEVDDTRRARREVDDAELDEFDDAAPRPVAADTETDVEDEIFEAHAYVDSDVDELPSAGPLDGDTVPIAPVQRAEVSAPAVSTAKAALAQKAEPTPKPAPAPKRFAAPTEMPLEAEGVDVDAMAFEELATEELAPAARTAAAEPAASEPVDAEIDSDTAAEAGTAESQADEAEPMPEVDELDADDVAADEALTEEVAPVSRAEVERIEEFDGPSRRRGGFDPENDARLSEARFRFRQRVTLALGVLAVVALGAGLMNVPFAWYALGALAIALVGYLTYLRRTVRIETEIRRRRTARLERARREREREAEVVDGVPAHLRRGGCVVMEIDDEDPAFDHLPRYRAEEFEFLRPSADLHEPVQRKVG